MRPIVWRVADTISAGSAALLTLVCFDTALTTRGISTIEGIFLLLLAYGSVMATAIFASLALEYDAWPLAIREEPDLPARDIKGVLQALEARG